MKTVSKLLRSIWAIALLVMLNVALPVGASGMSVSPIVYGEQVQMRIAYDGASSSAFDYDSASTLSTNETENRIREEGGVFAQFAEFLAAETTGGVLQRLAK